MPMPCCYLAKRLAIGPQKHTPPIPKKLYRSLEELQRDLDAWLVYDDEKRVHSGRYCYGKTPLKTLIDTQGMALEKNNELMLYQARTYGQELADKNIA